MLYRFFLVILLSVALPSYAQVNFHLTDQYLTNKNIIKVLHTADQSLWVLGENNFVARINPDKTIDDFSAVASSISTNNFIGIASINKDLLLIATANDYVVKLDHGIGSHLTVSSGIGEKDITSITVNQLGFKKNVVAFEPTVEIPGNYVVTTGKTIYYSTDAIVFKPVNRQYEGLQFDEAAPTIRNSTSKELYFDYYVPFNNGGRCYGFSNFIGHMYDCADLGLREQEYDINAKDNNDIRTALSTVRTINNYGCGAFVFWAADKGLAYANTDACNVEPAHHFLADQQVNKLAELNFLTGFPQFMLTYILAGTSNGLYVSAENAYDKTITTFNPLPNLAGLHINDIFCYNTGTVPGKQGGSPDFCEKKIYLATTIGVYELKYSLPPTALQPLSNNIFFDNAVSDNSSDKIILCPGSSVKLHTLAGAGINVQWQKDGVDISGAAQNEYNATAPGKYRVLFYSACENISFYSKELDVSFSNSPIVQFDYPDKIVLCENESIMLSTQSVAGYAYKWTENGVEIPGQHSNELTVSTTGDYAVLVSNCAGTYKPSKIVHVEITQLEEPVVSSAQSNFCRGDIALLSVNTAAGYSVKWFFNGTPIPGETKNTLATGISGRYAVEVSNQNCTKKSKELTITFTEPLSVKIQSSKGATICYGETVTLSTLPAASSYQWSNGATTPTIEVSRTGHYEVIVTNLSGCPSAPNAIDVVVQPAISLTTIPDTVLCTLNQEVRRIIAEDGFAYYTWNGVRSKLNYIDVNQAGTYSLTVEDISGCTKTITFLIKGVCNELIIPNTFTPNGDGINDLWTIGGLEKETNISLTIFNRYGSRISESGIPSWDGTSKGRPMPAGVYYYILKYSKNRPKNLSGWLTIIR